MNSSRLFSADRLGFLGSRILLCGIAVTIYFVIWRPARILITEHVVYPQVEYFEEDQTKYESGLQTGALLIFYEFNEGMKQLQYRPEFGFFFLVSLLALFFVTSSKKPYLVLTGMHFVGSILTYLFLMAGASGFLAGFIFVDAVAGYLVPAVSLSLVPLVVKGLIK